MKIENPYSHIVNELQELKSLFIDFKEVTLPEFLSNVGHPTKQVVDLDGLLKARSFIGSRSTIYKKVASGEIPHSKNGKRLIFDLHEIDEWLVSNKIKTTKEIQEIAKNLNRNNRR